MSYKKRRG